MNGLAWIRKIFLGLYSSVKRFPITLLFSSSVAIMLIIISESGTHIIVDTRDLLIRVTMILALGIPLSLCTKVYYERKKEENFSKLILYYAFAIMIQFLYFFFLLKNFSMVSLTRFMGINVVFYLCFLFIPFFPHRKNFEDYVIHLFIRFLITAIYAAILFLGLTAILFTVDHLLGMQVKEQTYFYTFLMVSLIFAPTYFLAYIPRKNQDFSSWEYPKILKILLLYIVMPLLSIYTLILYIYFGKILFSMEWPQGLVSHLVLWYGLLLTVVLFFIHPIKNENKWSRIFSTWLPRIVLPLILMMFASIGIRIHAYGFTENRYYVLVLGLWLFSAMIYLSLIKKRKFIYLAISLSIIVFLSVLSPVSSYFISKYSQNNRLEKILWENNMIKEGKIQPTKKNISNEDKQTISSILQYFDKNHSFKEVELLPENFEIGQMEKVFGFPYTDPNLYQNNYFFYQVNRDSKILDVSEYDFLCGFEEIYGNPQRKEDIFMMELIPNTNTITIIYNNNEIFEKDLSGFVEQLYEKYEFSPKTSDISVNDMTITEETDKYKFKFLMNHIGGQRSPEGNFQINEIHFDLLIKVK